MEIVIAGCGKVGYTLAQQLSSEGHSVTVIDQSYAKVSALTDNVDVIGVVGNCVSHKTLSQAGVPDADLLIAVTGNDEKNLLCCSIGRKAGHVRTIARVRDPLYNSEMAFLRRTFELSDIINPELEAAQEISRIFQFPAAIGVDTFAKGGVDLLSFQVAASSILNGLHLKDFRRQIHSHILVCMVLRGGEVTIPDGNFCLQAGDLAGDTQIENISASSRDIDLIRADSRVNSTTAKQPRALENTGLSDSQPICEVTVSYADEPDLGAVADVLDLLTHANYGR